MTDYINSLLSNIKTRIRNPLLGTLIFVWIIRNWEIVYSLFNFDEECVLSDKLLYINSYFIKKNFWYELWINLGVTFLILLSTYFLLAVSKAIVDFYYKVIEKRITRFIDKHSIVNKEEYNTLIKQLEGVIKDKDEKTTEFMSLTRQTTEKESIISSLNKENEILQTTNEELREKNKSNEEKIADSLKKNDFLQNENLFLTSTINDVRNKYMSIIFDSKDFLESQITMNNIENNDNFKNLSSKIRIVIDEFSNQNNLDFEKKTIQENFAEVYRYMNLEDIKSFFDFKNRFSKVRSDFNILPYNMMLKTNIIIEKSSGIVALGSNGQKFMSYLEKMTDKNLNIFKG